MTTWVKDLPPSANTSAIFGCAKFENGRFGDTTECHAGCDPVPTIEITTHGDVQIIINQGGLNG